MDKKDLLTAGFVGFGIATISMYDQPSNIWLVRHSGSPFLNTANTFGAKEFLFPATALIFGGSLLTKDQHLQDAAFTSLQSLLMTMVTVNTVKFLAGRERPFHHNGPYDFDPIEGGGTSFPSGHTAGAFAALTPWVVYYPGPLTYSLMALPAGTAIARIARGKHWLSDVAAGAIIGFSMGYYLSRRHLGINASNLEITPSFGRETAALSVNFRF